MKVGEIRRRLRRERWEIVRQRGSHEQWKHASFDLLITLYGKDSQEPSPGVMADIRKEGQVEMRYAAVIEQADDGTWSAFVPDLACYVVGLESPERARKELRVSIAFAVEGRRLEGRPMPPPTTQVELEAI